MPLKCCVVGCSNRGGRAYGQYRFFRFPNDWRSAARSEITAERSVAWLRAINRSDLKNSSLKHTCICSDHFITGSPARPEDKLHPDWVPSLKMGYRTKPGDLARYNRRFKRDKQAGAPNDATANDTSIVEEDAYEQQLQRAIKRKAKVSIRSKTTHIAGPFTDGEKAQLIELVKPHPHLYDPRNEHYMNYIKKQLKWVEIGSKFNVSGTSISGRWRTVREQYIRFKNQENRRLDKLDKTVPKLIQLPFFDQMSFLDDCLQEICSHFSRKRDTEPSLQWHKQHVILFLDELKNLPLLYDKTHPDYCDKNKKTEALQTIIAKLQPFRRNIMTTQYITRKIKEFKYQYRNEKMRLKASLNHHHLAPGETPYEPKLWFFNRLCFLDNKGAYKKIADTSALSDESDLELEDSADECYVDTAYDPVKPFEEVNLGNMDDQEETIDQTLNSIQSKRSRIVECLTREMEAVNSDFGYEREEREVKLPFDHDYARSVLKENCSRLLECVSTKMETITSNRDHNQQRHVLLGEMVETELSNVSAEIYAEAKWKILHILEKASKRSRGEKTQPSLPSALSPVSNQFYDWAAKAKATVPSIGTPICSKVQTLHIDIFNRNK